MTGKWFRTNNKIQQTPCQHYDPCAKIERQKPDRFPESISFKPMLHWSIAPAATIWNDNYSWAENRSMPQRPTANDFVTVVSTRQINSEHQGVSVIEVRYRRKKKCSRRGIRNRQNETHCGGNIVDVIMFPKCWLVLPHAQHLGRTQILCPGQKNDSEMFRNICFVRAACNNVATFCHWRATS